MELFYVLTMVVDTQTYMYKLYRMKYTNEYM